MVQPFFSFREIIDMIIMISFLGFIFMDHFKKPTPIEYDPLENLNKRGFDWGNFKFAILVVAPGILFHELGHKFSAMSFGMTATFHAAYMWLIIGFILKLVRFNFIFFVPAYVSFTIGTASQNAIVAFMGPFVNLVLWLGAYFYLKFGNVKRKYVPVIVLTQKINMFLFIFNMLPIPPFDGWGVFSNLFSALNLGI